jgi:transposase, IS5 family
MLQQRSMIDGTIIHAPSSTKNESGQRDPEMSQTKKCNQWYFGMKALIGVDTDSGLVHTVVTTPANEADIEVADELLHGKEQTVHADAGYTGGQTSVTPKKGASGSLLPNAARSATCPRARPKSKRSSTNLRRPASGQKSNTPFTRSNAYLAIAKHDSRV